MWQTVYDKLKVKGLNPYPPGKHIGECTEPYCVVREGTQSPSLFSNRVGRRLVEVILFVPVSSYVGLIPYANAIKLAMAELGSVRKTGNETPVITDDEVKAYTTSIEYQVMKKLEG